jgi:hypothetical protein
MDRQNKTVVRERQSRSASYVLVWREAHNETETSGYSDDVLLLSTINCQLLSQIWAPTISPGGLARKPVAGDSCICLCRCWSPLLGLCCVNSVDCILLVTHSPEPSSGKGEDIEQPVDKAHLVLDLWLAAKAMDSADHPHHLEPLDGSRRLIALDARDRKGSGTFRCESSGGSFGTGGAIWCGRPMANSRQRTPLRPICMVGVMEQPGTRCCLLSLSKRLV